MLCVFSMSVRTSPIPRIREASRSGWNGSSAVTFSPTPTNLIGAPVMRWIESAAPPRASPSIFVRITPVIAELLVERLRDVDRFLAGHRVGDEEDLRRRDRRLDLLQLVHQPLVDLQPSGRVDDDRGDREPLRLGDALARDRDRVALSAVEDRQIDLLAERLELIDRRGPVDVGRDEHRAATLLLEAQGELGRVRRLSGTLQPDHEVHGRRRVAVGEARRRAAHDLDQLVVDELDDASAPGSAR